MKTNTVFLSYKHITIRIKMIMYFFAGYAKKFGNFMIKLFILKFYLKNM